MRISVPFNELTSFISAHYGKEVIFCYVNDHEISISTTVNALFLSKTIGVSVSLLDVIDNDVKMSYTGGLGTDILIKGILKSLSSSMSACNQIVEASSGNTLTIYLNKIEQLKKVFDYFRLEHIFFEKDCAVIDASFR